MKKMTKRIEFNDNNPEHNDEQYHQGFNYLSLYMYSKLSEENIDYKVYLLKHEEYRNHEMCLTEKEFNALVSEYQSLQQRPANDQAASTYSRMKEIISQCLFEE